MELKQITTEGFTRFEAELAGKHILRIIPIASHARWPVQVLNKNGKIVTSAAIRPGTGVPPEKRFEHARNEILPEAMRVLKAMSAQAQARGSGLMAKYGQTLSGDSSLLDWFIINNNDTSASMSVAIPDPVNPEKFCKIQVYQSGYKTRRSQYRYEAFLTELLPGHDKPEVIAKGVFSIKSDGTPPELNVIQHNIFKSLASSLSRKERLEEILNKSEQKGA